MNSILNRKMEEDTVLEKRENQEHLFSPALDSRLQHFE
mgnify:CR=1 FL=1